MKHTVTQYIGVDVAKPGLDFDLPVPADHIANTPEAITAALRALPAGAHLVCESTGGYEAALLAAAHAAGVPISVIPPQRVRHHARSAGRLAKTDRLDAALLSDYGRKHTPAARPVPQPQRVALRELVRARAQLIELKKTEASWREHPPAAALLRAQAKKREALLDRQLAEVESAIRALVSGQAELERLQQVQGVGEVTAWTVWAEVPELGHLAPGQPAALVGLAPYACDSSQHHGKRFVQQGRPHVRRVLYMAAVTACQHNPVLKEFYRRLRARGKPAKVALIAVARRLIELLNLLLKNPNFVLAG